MPPSSQRTFEQHIFSIVNDEAPGITKALLRAAEKSRGNEAELTMHCDSLLSGFAERMNLVWQPQGERRVVWQEEDTTKSGFIDRLFSRVVVEFEPPGSLHPTNKASRNRHALKQAKEYINALITKEGWKAPSVAGVVTDGFRFVFCRYSGRQWVEEAPVDTSTASVARFLRLLLSFKRPPLLPDPLLKRFGSDSEVTVNTVRAFYRILAAPTHRLTDALFVQWQDYFADIAGLDAANLEKQKELMRFAQRVMESETVDASRLLFALYTYSALFFKLVAVAAVMPFFDSTDLDRLSNWAALGDDELCLRLKEVETGSFFQAIVTNFTEGDFFGWYCNEWNSDLAQQVRQLISELSEFDPDSVEQAPERVRDLLKRLYHGLFPKEVRHDLGEYYTPDWLAQRLLAQLDHELFGELSSGMGDDKRAEIASAVRHRLTSTSFLDPACGSGTFLVLIIRRLRQWARECGISERDKLLPALVKKVVGFDLNPLAVLSARANFLLAIADLLKPGDLPIELPVYLADSVVLPAEGQGDSLYSAPKGIYELPLRGVGKTFLVPKIIASQHNLNLLSHQLRQDIESGADCPSFLKAFQAKVSLTAHQWEECEKQLAQLYDTLLQLHKDGRNGLWSDIVRNMFMPMFVPRANFVVGNPPWVNWESLPDDYRTR